MIAENDNLTAEQFRTGMIAEKSMAHITTTITVLACMRDWPEAGTWIMVKRMMERVHRGFQPVAIPVAMMPHPGCPPWDGKTPGMSRGYPASKTPARPNHLRSV